MPRDVLLRTLPLLSALTMLPPCCSGYYLPDVDLALRPLEETPTPTSSATPTHTATPTYDDCPGIIELSPSEGPPGTEVAFGGMCYYYHSGRYGRIFFDDLHVCTVSGDTGGNFSGSFIVPLCTSAGEHEICSESSSMRHTFLVLPRHVVDADGDCIADDIEARVPALGQTNLYLPDSDGDAIPDGLEDANGNGVHSERLETDPRNRDTDGDGYEDRIEGMYSVGISDPTDPYHPPYAFVDDDGDALPDDRPWWSEPILDPDPSTPDVDGDRFLDGYEAVSLGLESVEHPARKPFLGDVDANSIWDNADAQHILNFFAHIIIPDGIADADLDRNATIDNADAQQSLNFFAHWTPYLPVR